MAPLKVEVARDNQTKVLEYPWLKGRGSIEGELVTELMKINKEIKYPWLKGRGSIEANMVAEVLTQPHSSGYPWLKGRGSIEGSPKYSHT